MNDKTQPGTSEKQQGGAVQRESDQDGHAPVKPFAAEVRGESKDDSRKDDIHLES